MKDPKDFGKWVDLSAHGHEGLGLRTEGLLGTCTVLRCGESVELSIASIHAALLQEALGTWLLIQVTGQVSSYQ